MQVDESTNLKVEQDGDIYYFCSEHCQQKFLEANKEESESHSCCNHEQPRPSSKGLPTKYICPMCEGIESNKPADCPKCGMALEPAQPPAPIRKTIYTCPMHPEIEQNGPGSCPICGMDLEPKYVEATEEDNSELRNITLRFWISLALSIPVLLLAMLPMLKVPIDEWLGHTANVWLQLILSTPVVLWGGLPFFVRGWRSVVNRSLNMFTLIAIGTGAAYLFSLFVVLFPGLIPAELKTNGRVEVYFEAAAVIITLVLLGQVLELRASLMVLLERISK